MSPPDGKGPDGKGSDGKGASEGKSGKIEADVELEPQAEVVERVHENENIPAFVALGSRAGGPQNRSGFLPPSIKASASRWPIPIPKRSSRICATRTSTRTRSAPTWTRCSS